MLGTDQGHLEELCQDENNTSTSRLLQMVCVERDSSRQQPRKLQYIVSFRKPFSWVYFILVLLLGEFNTHVFAMLAFILG
jgi:hypothetical protein